MTLTIDLLPAILEQMKAEAAATGKDVQTVAREAVEARFAHRRQTLAQILKPIHDEVDSGGMGEPELEALVDESVASARADCKASRTQQ